MPSQNRDRTAGAALRVVERAKTLTYPEFASGRRYRLVVLGTEVGHWRPRAAEFARLLARSGPVPFLLPSRRCALPHLCCARQSY